MKSLTALFFIFCFTANAMNHPFTGQLATQSFVLPSAQNYANAYVPPLPYVPPATYTVKTANGTVELNPQQIEKFKVLKRAKDFETSVQSGKYASTYELNQITNEQFASILACVDDINRIKHLTIPSLEAAMQVADMLQAPKKFRQKLALKLIARRTFKEYEPFFQKMICLNLPVSIDTLKLYKWSIQPIDEIEQPIDEIEQSIDEKFEQRGNFTVDLSNLNLDSIEGIERLSSPNTKILQLNNNNLKQLDLSRIKKVFPNICQVDASHNKITMLTKQDIGAFTNGLRIFLNNNRINTVDRRYNFKTPENIYIDIQGNKLTSDALQNLNQSLEPFAYQTIYDTAMQNIYQNRIKMSLGLVAPIYLDLSHTLVERTLRYSAVLQYRLLGKEIIPCCQILVNIFGWKEEGSMLFKEQNPISKATLCLYLSLFVANLFSLKLAWMQPPKQFKHNIIKLSPGVSYIALKMREQRQSLEKQRAIKKQPADDLD